MALSQTSVPPRSSLRSTLQPAPSNRCAMISPSSTDSVKFFEPTTTVCFSAQAARSARMRRRRRMRGFYAPHSKSRRSPTFRGQFLRAVEEQVRQKSESGGRERSRQNARRVDHRYAAKDQRAQTSPADRGAGGGDTD